MSEKTDLLYQGMTRLETGNRHGAARYFVLLIRQDPNDETAWWMLASCVDSIEQKRDCLQRVLEINPWNSEARNALEQLDLTAPDPLALAKAAEDIHDYEAAYQYYAQVTENKPTCVDAWFGKGFTAGMLSTPDKNGVREFFHCLGKGLRATGMVTANLQGLTLEQLAPRLDLRMAQALTAYLHTLFDFITGLADRCPPNMANIYSVERVHLADWAFFTQHLEDANVESFFSKEKLSFIVIDAFTRIATVIHQTTRGPRSRHELLGNYKFFLLSNLSLSKLSQDTHLIDRLDSIQARFS